MKFQHIFLKHSLITGIYLVVNFNLFSQPFASVSVNYSLLYSQLQYHYDYNYQMNGIKTMRQGAGCSIKFETGMNKRISIYSGISCETRKNSYVTGFIVDTAAQFSAIRDAKETYGEWWSPVPYAPYKYSASHTFYFIGIPVGVNINYIVKPKFRLYQQLGLQFNYMFKYQLNRTDLYYKDIVIDSTVNRFDGENNIIVHISSSIGVTQNLGKNIALKIEPGVVYMINNIFYTSKKREKFIDFKVDMGIVYMF